MKLYALYDTYEVGIEPGELICTSDSMAEIRAAAREYLAPKLADKLMGEILQELARAIVK